LQETVGDFRKTIDAALAPCFFVTYSIPNDCQDFVTLSNLAQSAKEKVEVWHKRSRLHRMSSRCLEKLKVETLLALLIHNALSYLV